MLLSVYALVALASTVLATPTPVRELKQVTRADIVRRSKRGVRPRAPVPSGAGGPPTTVTTSPFRDRDPFVYTLIYTGSGAILSDSPSGQQSRPIVSATYANTVSTASAAQQCVDLGYRQLVAPASGAEYLGVSLWFDESDDLWHCRATFDANVDSDYSAVDANARPVYGYSGGWTST